jgi:hypothetical protein
MSSYDGPATIRQGETEVQVSCGYTYRPPSDARLGEWHGRFTGASGPLEPREAELVLPTGETGQIILTHVNGWTRASGLFQGTGPAPG